MDVRLPDGRIVQNVPEGTTQEELFARLGIEAPKKDAPVVSPSWFPGQSYISKPKPEDVSSAVNLTREIFHGVPADMLAGPAQMIAGLGDVAASGVSKLVGLQKPAPFASQEVSKVRNLLAGRPGVESGPMTPFAQSITTSPMTGSKMAGAFIQGAGIGGGLASPSEDVLMEGLKGGAWSAIGSRLGSIIGKSKSPSNAQARLDEIAAKEGIDRTYGMKTGSELARNLESRAERNIMLGGLGTTNYAQGLHGKIDDQLAEAVWKRAGQKFKEFTQDNINAATREIGSRLDLPFQKVKEIPFGGMRLQTAVDDAIETSYSMTRPDELIKAAVVVDNKIAVGKLSASELNVIADDLRGLAQKAYDDSNKVAGDKITKLYSAVRGAAVSAIPDQAGRDAYMKALTQYANLQVIKDAFVRSVESPRGNLDFTKLKPAIERSMKGGYAHGRADLSELADLGLSMRSTGVLNEGVKWSPFDATLYALLNNSASRALRDRSPVDAEEARRLLAAAGLQLGTQ